MPLNKLDNFIKNTEGRILYVSPSDLDSTDSIDNQGNSLARPFKTLQRALLESARFSYVQGKNNDLVEKTTILLMPGEHIIDNRPGHKIYKNADNNIVIEGSDTTLDTNLGLSLDSNFDINQKDNDLVKFNSFYGGVIIPRGTSIVGLDLRKTKIRPLYVPNPLVDLYKSTAIFRITGACYFWQFSIFDGDELGTVYTNPGNFDDTQKATPTFSHHKLTVFEYADGVNKIADTGLTDLDMYYAKLSIAYESSSGRAIDGDDRFGNDTSVEPSGFAKQRPEWEIVGAFATDPVVITELKRNSGENTVTVTAEQPHGFSVGTPVKIRDVLPVEYNVSTKVTSVDPDDPTKFTYELSGRSRTLASGSSSDNNSAITISGANVTIETDTVTGASPYIFNISMRSVWGMNGMHADGSKASGFRSMVVAQFTGVSLQKDDRAFAKYIPDTRIYDVISYDSSPSNNNPSTLSSESSSKVESKIFHLDPDAVYRSGWETTHIKISNDAVMQIVSVFAIGYTKHFEADTGGDASITNSNSNFGQLALVSKGFKKDAFDKDDKAFITNIITPKAITSQVKDIDWIGLDVNTTLNTYDASDETSVNFEKNRLYLFGFKSKDIKPQILTQGFRVGAKIGDKLKLEIDDTNTAEAEIYMTTGPDNEISAEVSSVKQYFVAGDPDNNQFNIGLHQLSTGENIRIISDSGDLPENISENTLYYAIVPDGVNDKIEIASSLADAFASKAINVYKGKALKILSRVTDKSAGDIGHPVQFDKNNGWYIQTESDSNIWTQIFNNNTIFENNRTNETFIQRTPDSRSLDDKIYKVRVVIPKQLKNAKTPESGFIIQESSTVDNYSANEIGLINSSIESPFGRPLTTDNYLFDRNTHIIHSVRVTDTLSNGFRILVRCEQPHNLQVGNNITIKNVRSSDNVNGSDNTAFNGDFTVYSIENELEFKYDNIISSLGTTDIILDPNDSGGYINNAVRGDSNNRLPSFSRKDCGANLFVYRNEIIQEYIEDSQDGIYHIYVLNASNNIEEQFTDFQYGQNVVDFYPQLDRDNIEDNPVASKSYAVRSPIGKVVTNDLKNSITRESIDKFSTTFGLGKIITNVETDSEETTGITTVTFDRPHGLGRATEIKIDSKGYGYDPGNYYNVRLLSGNTSNYPQGWKGLTVNLEVSTRGEVSKVVVANGGSQIEAGQYYIYNEDLVEEDPTSDSGAVLSVADSAISKQLNDVVQVTGIGTTSGGYYRIHDIPSTTTVALARSTSDPQILTNEYVYITNPASNITQDPYGVSGPDPDDGETTFTCSNPHGLVAGNKFRVIDNTDTNLGDFVVTSAATPLTFTSNLGSGVDLSSSNVTFVYKHAFASNAVAQDSDIDSIATRGIHTYDGETAKLLPEDEDLTANATTIRLDIGTSTGYSKRFPVGSYIQIDDEIIRIAGEYNSTDDNFPVIRGALVTRQESHSAGSLVRKVNPIAVEFRRPSVIRASGHTFEYLGYGPGNYSTGLPQLQQKSLSEREEFLVQSQEQEGGIVVYTGMNNRGDFYIGNQKKTSSTGEEVTFDTPIPTVAGEDASRLSVVFDEVTIKERLVVEGGSADNILSQFDGPVTFNNETNFNAQLTANESIVVKNETESTTTETGSFITRGGAAIKKGLNVGGIATFRNNNAIHIPAEIINEVKTGDIVIGELSSSAGIGTTSIRIYKNINPNTSNYDGVIENTSGNFEIRNILFGENPTNKIILGNAHTSLDEEEVITVEESHIEMNANGSVNLFHNGDEKLKTTESGVIITGIATVSTSVMPSAHKRKNGNTASTGQTVGSSSLPFKSGTFGDITIGDNKITTHHTNANLILSPNGTGTVDVGETNTKRNFNVNGNTTLGVDANSTLGVNGKATFNNAVDVKGTLSVKNGTTNNFTVTTAGAVTSKNSITITNSGNGSLFAVNNTTANTFTINKAGNTTISGTLTVNANTTLGDTTGNDTTRVNGNLNVTKDITAFYSSDEKLKDNITPIEDPLAKVISISGNTFDWNENSDKEGSDTGVIAQEIEALELPGLVTTRDNGYKAVRYEKLVPLLIEAIKELNEKVDVLEQRLQDK